MGCIVYKTKNSEYRCNIDDRKVSGGILGNEEKRYKSLRGGFIGMPLEIVLCEGNTIVTSNVQSVYNDTRS